MRQTYGPWWHPESNPLKDIREFMREAEEDDRSSLVSHRVPIGVMREDVVESETFPGTYYTLRLKEDGTWSCECPGYQYRQDCKHVRRKMEEDGWRSPRS